MTDYRRSLELVGNRFFFCRKTQNFTDFNGSSFGVGFDAIASPIVAVTTVSSLAQNLLKIEEVEEIRDRIKRLLETR